MITLPFPDIRRRIYAGISSASGQSKPSNFIRILRNNIWHIIAICVVWLLALTTSSGGFDFSSCLHAICQRKVELPDLWPRWCDAAWGFIVNVNTAKVGTALTLFYLFVILFIWVALPSVQVGTHLSWVPVAFSIQKQAQLNCARIFHSAGWQPSENVPPQFRGMGAISKSQFITVKVTPMTEALDSVSCVPQHGCAKPVVLYCPGDVFSRLPIFSYSVISAT